MQSSAPGSFLVVQGACLLHRDIPALQGTPLLYREQPLCTGNTLALQGTLLLSRDTLAAQGTPLLYSEHPCSVTSA